MFKFSKGSEWRKWDLHIHSNASDGTSSPEEIIAEAKKKGLSVIALTDHHTVGNVDILKELGRKPENNIAVISGIEFRTEYGSKSVHLIGLFPDSYANTKLDSRALDDLILSKLDISKTQIIKKGLEYAPSASKEEAFKNGTSKVQVDFKKAADLIHLYGGLVSVHNGSKTNGIDSEIKHEGSAPKNTKALYEQLGTLKEELLQNFVDICEINKADDSENFYLEKFNNPSIIASDAHNNNKIGEKYVWIKADPTFEGLKQIIFEPAERVRIQEAIPEEKYGYQVIDSITLNGRDFGDTTIPLSQNLTSIIGGRSAGKSTLLSLIAKKIKPNDENNKNEFIKDLIENISVTWKDGTDNADRDIDYFPQSYMYEIANNGCKVDSLVSNILKEDPTKKEKFDQYENQILSIKKQLVSQITNIFDLQKQYNDIETEIKNIGDEKGIGIEIARIENQIVVINQSSSLSTDEQKKFEDLQVQLAKKKQSDTNIQKDIQAIKSLTTKSIVNESLKYELNAFSDIVKTSIESEFSNLCQEFKGRWSDCLQNKIFELEKKSSTLVDELKAIEKDELYTKGLANIESNQQYKILQEQLSFEKLNLEKIKKKYETQKNIKYQINQLRESIIEFHCSFASNAENIIIQLKLTAEELEITSNKKFQKEKVKEFLESRMIQRSNEQKNYIVELSEQYHQNTGEKIKTYLEKALKEEHEYKGGSNNQNVVIEFLSTNWYSITHDLIYQKDTFKSMSPGKQAFVILKLLLEFSNRKCPILIDQPEDSLDNRAIYTELVDYLRKKKKVRQIILVTHNPNVVVGADSEEVIVANQHGINSKNTNDVKFSYISGSLENTSPHDNTITTTLEAQGIREHVYEILEGGKDAFEKREKKYGFRR